MADLGSGGQQYYAQQPPPTAPTNGFAITALVSSLVFAPLGVIFGHLALKQISRSGENGRGLAIGGLVIGYLFTALSLVVLSVMGVLIALQTNKHNERGPVARQETETVEVTPPTLPSQRIVMTLQPGVADNNGTIGNRVASECLKLVPGVGVYYGYSCGESTHKVDTFYYNTTDPGVCPESDGVIINGDEMYQDGQGRGVMCLTRLWQ